MKLLPTQAQPAAQSSPPPARQALLQRKCACGGTPGVDGECAACRARRLQRKTAAQAGLAPPIVHDVLRGPGQPLGAQTRASMESRFGYDFSRVRVHADTRAAASARAVSARAYTVGRDVVFAAGQYAPQTGVGRRLLAHELAHVVQQSAGDPTPALQIEPPSSPSEAQSERAAEQIARGEAVTASPLTLRAPAVMRDLAQVPPESVPEQVELTAAQIQAALRYNRASYDEASTRLIQDLVGAPQTGTFDELTVRLVALIQRQFGLVPADGKVGPDTYDFLIRELQAEGVTPGTCLTLFQIVGPQPLTFFRTSPTAGVINSRVEVHARFDPRCTCGDFEYRQFISGHVELLETARPGVTPPATSGCATLASTLPGIWVWDLDGCFQIPGGGLSRRWREDGDVAVPAGVAGRRYGHRSARPNSADRRDVYSPDRATGCVYEAFDVPELAPVPATPADSGDVYDWEMRFRGVIQRSDGTVVAEKWWSIIRTLPIP